MLFYILFIALQVNSEYIDVQTKCECEELLLQEECNLQNDCYWYGDENKCIFIGKCSYITSPVHCIEKVKCAYIDGQCTDFTKCSDYKGDKTFCEQVSELCTSYNGNDCSDKQIYTCKDYDEDVCNHSFGKEGECIYKYNECKMLESCNEIGSNTFKCIMNVHSCKPQNGECVDKECYHLQSKSDCQYVHAYDPKDIVKKIELCQWIDGQCKESQLKNINEEQCFSWLEKSHHWSQQFQSCVQCQGQQPIPNYIQLIQIGLIILILQ